MSCAPEDVLAAAKQMLADGLVQGTAGNISGRLVDGTVCLTPSSVPYETMTLDDLVIVDLDGTVRHGHRGPTSEKDLHLSVLRAYDEVGAVVHTHALHATMFAVAHEPIPAVIEEVVVYLGGDIPCCDHRPTGSKALGDEVADKLADRSAALLANHGLVTCGATPAEALHHAALAERTARVVWGARVMGATIHPLPERSSADMAGVYRMLRGRAG
jgi:L-fuculose-phosphate aldolase